MVAEHAAFADRPGARRRTDTRTRACAGVSASTSVDCPSTSMTTGPLVLPMSSSSSRQPSAAENHHDAPGRGPDVQRAGDEVARAVGVGVVGAPVHAVGIGRQQLRRSRVGIDDVQPVVETGDQLDRLR